MATFLVATCLPWWPWPWASVDADGGASGAAPPYCHVCGTRDSGAAPLWGQAVMVRAQVLGGLPALPLEGSILALGGLPAYPWGVLWDLLWIAPTLISHHCGERVAPTALRNDECLCAHACCPRLLPTPAAHACCPRLLPTPAAHACCPCLLPTPAVHACCPRLLHRPAELAAASALVAAGSGWGGPSGQTGSPAGLLLL